MISNIMENLFSLLFYIAVFVAGYVFLKQKLEKSAQRKAALERMNKFNDTQVELEIYYRDFVIDQIERERNLREAEEKHSAIFSASKRPFQNRNLPTSNASFDEIADITGINSFEECDKRLLCMNPYRAIIDKTYSRRMRASGQEQSRLSIKPGTWLFDIAWGLFVIIVGTGTFIEFYNCEQNGTMANMPDMVNIFYHIGGKWLIGLICWLFGLIKLFEGVDKFRFRKR